MKEKYLQIGSIAKEAGVNIQTLRYYERINLLKPQLIKESGYRLYSKEVIQTIRFIKHSQELGFKLDEIKELLNLRAPTKNRCNNVRIRAQLKLSDIDEKLEVLSRIKKSLNKLIKDCEDNKTSQSCPIIKSIEGI